MAMLNEKTFLEGAAPEEQLLGKILEAANSGGRV